MSTVIEKIKDAEQKAEEIRNKALEQSREDIRKAQENILRQQKEKIAKAKLDARNKLEEVEKQIAKDSVVRYKKDSEANEDYKNQVADNVDKAADIIVKRILEN